jgi:hemerythrin-like domain-containing protein
MLATEMLMNEHRVIERVLDCLERMAEIAEETNKVDAASARQALDFFAVFADQCHHRKEEEHLFPLMEARGFRHEDSAVGCLLDEHSIGRRHVRAIAAALDALHAGCPSAAHDFADRARAYVAFLREHIAKEDAHLFPMANRVFGAGDRQLLLDAFDDVEQEHAHAGTHEKYLQLADTLAERFQVGRTALLTCGCGCGHHART